MKVNRSHGMMVTVSKNQISKSFFIFTIVLVSVFVLTGMLTSLKPEYRITSSSINNWTTSLTGKSFIHVLGLENRYFVQAAPEGSSPPNLSTVAFEMATSINPDDPRSLLGRELPGFDHFDGEIIIAGEGTNYTNMPYESAPPIEVLLEERKASVENLKEVDKHSDKVEPPAMTTKGKKVVYIYATHSRESYLPHLPEVKDPDQSYHKEVNVMKVGERLGQELEQRGIGVQVSENDFTGTLINKGLNYTAESYDVSRPVVKQVLAKNKDIQFVIDVHRDALRKKNTTVTINGKPFARIAFIVGGEHAKYEKNLKVATDLHKLIDKKYPGLSRGVTTKQGAGTNGKFNQDLFPNALLIEFGGVDNSLTEVYRTADAVAEAFSEYYWQAEKVNR